MSAESKPVEEVTSEATKLEESKTSNVEESKVAPDTHTLESAMKAFGISNPAERRDKSHQFWNTQPVPVAHDGEEGEIEKDNKVEDVRKEPLALFDQFEWTDFDLNDAANLDEIYKFLSENYVEDDDGLFRFDYSKDFLRWALTPPGYYKDWIFGVRVKKSKKIVGFITGIPVHVNTSGKKIKMAEINFLCVHKKLRSNRLAPVLIKEVTRRVHLRNIWQAIYTSGTRIPTPITEARYYHRSLNPKKLIDIKFSSLPPNQTLSRMVKLYRLPEEPKIEGVREFKTKDIAAVTKLLQEHLVKSKVHLRFTEEDVKHWLIPRKDVIYSYVVEKDKKITDFISFYCLPSSVLNNPKHTNFRAAYSYYNVATSVSMIDLMNDALTLALKENFDVFNALDILNNHEVFQELKFNMGSGNLHYYFYNWRLNKPLDSNEMGVVLL